MVGIQNKHCVVVLGMHRSGTSALTKWLVDTGFSLPSAPLPPHPEDNPGGYWESRDVVILNDQMMSELGSDWKDVNPLPFASFPDSSRTRNQNSMVSLLKSATDNSPQIVIKDPRLCRLLPIWMPVLEDQFHQVAIVFVVRHPDSVFQSISRRWISKEIRSGAIVDRQHSDALWLRYNLDAEHYSKRVSRIVIGYENFVSNPVAVSKQIFHFLQSKLQGVQLRWNQPIIQIPKSKSDPDRGLKNDTERTVNQAYETLLGQGSRDYLDALHANADICIPTKHQHEMPSPSRELVAKAFLKHICGRVVYEINTATSGVGLEKHCKPVVYISDMVKGRSHIYRVKNMVDALNSEGIRAWWTTSLKAAEQLSSLDHSQAVVIHRSQWNDSLEKIYAYCRERNIVTVFDIDDLVFEPEFIDSSPIHFITQLDPQEKHKWIKRMNSNRQSLVAANRCIVSTTSLARYVSKLAINSDCVPNGFSSETLDLSLHWASQPRISRDKYRIGYASGSYTHAADFALVAEPLAEFLLPRPDWILTIVGNLDFSKYVGQFNPNQIEHRPLVEHVNLAYELARLDINLIPLERNPFCDSKSPLKWYEAAICGVPSVAISNPVYEDLFEKGFSGLLARDEQSWLEQIERLARDPALRTEIADNALTQCLETFSQDKLAQKLMKVLN